MPFNAKGVFQRIFNWREDRDAGIEIRANRMDRETDGIVKGLNDILQGEVSFKAPIKTVGGTAANPAFSFSEHATTGFFRKPDGSIGLSINGVEVGAFSAAFFTGITEHYEATDNPHHVTAEQVGAIPVTDYTAENILTKLRGVDGPGSDLDADTLDGSHKSAFVQTTQNIIAGDGLTGGGPLSGDVRIDLDRAFQVVELERQLSDVTKDFEMRLAEVQADQSAAWLQVTDKPSTFPPSPHTHRVQQVNGITISTANPSGGQDGDLWFQV